MQKLSDRLFYILKSKNISKAELSRIINVPPQTVSDALAERRGLPDRCLLAICKKWPQVSYEWLKLGNGTAPIIIEAMENPNPISQQLTEHEQRLVYIEAMLQEILNHFKASELEKIQDEKRGKIKAFKH